MAAEQPSCADFKFNPPEDRLILEYLRPFALGRITGAESVINDDPYRAEPWELLAEHQRDIEESAFFFAKKTMVGTRRSRTVGENGTWRTQNSEKRAVDDGGGRVVAVFRKTLLSYYYLGGNQIMSTGYVMYEYELYVDSDGRGGGGTYDSMLCHVKKSCREVARSNKRKRKREFQSACNSSAIECNPYPYPYSAAAASSLEALPGCRSSLCPCEAPVVIDSADGLPESRARNQQSAISLSENSQWRGLPEPACEAPVVVVDDTDANRNSMISLSRSPELEARNEMSGTPESRAISETSSEALAVANANYAASQSETKLFESASETLACPESANAQSGPPSPKAILEPPSEATTDITSTDLSRSKLRTISQPTFGSKDAAFLVLLPSEASSDGAETPSENKPQQEEPPSDSSNKSETLYSVGELIDILVTADPAATRIFDHL